jgi:lipopolysaccharide/colanic/teichoic acid biosynthesis glycosyltransferase
MDSGRADFAAPYDLQSHRWQSSGFFTFKRAFDLFVCVALLPALVLTGLALVILNPFLNRGRLLYSQDRMGQGCVPFRAFKFRTMTDAPAIARGAFDGLEHHRITRLGRVLRRTRLDELPQIINVLRGEMSVIGPRPDYLPHARIYLDEVRGYRERHLVRPGISGYAQIVHGYVDGPDGIRRKVDADLHYIRHASVPFELWITWHTFLTVVFRRGS